MALTKTRLDHMFANTLATLYAREQGWQFSYWPRLTVDYLRYLGG